MTDIADWVFEGVLQYLRSPLWTTPVHGFIEKYCHDFVVDEEENKLIYTQRHGEFRELVDELLSSFLGELGVSGEAFIEAIKCGENPELSEMVAEFLFALDDFPSFRALMEKKNLELELEAMYEYARISSNPPQLEDDEMTDEERFLFDMAIRMSLGDTEITMKRLEKEDAELLQALALSLAVEQERLVREQIQEGQTDATPAGGVVSASPNRATMEQLNEEVRQQRVANVERVLFELQNQPQDGPAVVHSSITPSQDAQRLVQRSLAPVGERRAGGPFGARGSALPGISSNAPLAPAPATTTVAQPSFQALREQAAAKISAATGAPAPGASEPSKEELEQRAAYFKAQREKLLQQKAEARERELEQYKRERQMDTPANTTAAQPVVSNANEADATKEMRLALARRFREDLVQESRKAAGGQ